MQGQGWILETLGLFPQGASLGGDQNAINVGSAMREALGSVPPAQRWSGQWKQEQEVR